MLPNHNKGLQQLMVLHTSHHFYTQNTNEHNITKEFSQSPVFNANGIRNKIDEIQILIQNTQAES